MEMYYSCIFIATSITNSHLNASTKRLRFQYSIVCLMVTRKVAENAVMQILVQVKSALVKY